ncbi:hypothetical protein [Streptomyces sp. NPDC050804]|uniref:hypothetical protein n=1 Tax=Streptomyces sp. NPDC050804 TaxID=3154745 RepID=UPI0034430B72
MSVGFDVGEALAGVRGRGGVWGFVRGFAEGWRVPLGAGDGYGEWEIADAERRLGFALPVAVREAYGLFGRRRDLTSNQDRLLAPRELVVREGALVYRVENQYAAEWGVLLADLDQDDPPVYVRGAAGSPGRPLPFLDRFSLACVEMVLAESVFGAPDGLGDNRHLDGVDPGYIASRYTRVPLPDCPLWAVDGGVTRWFSAPGVLLREDAGQWLWVLARTGSALARVRNELPGDWLLSVRS